MKCSYCKQDLTVYKIDSHLYEKQACKDCIIIYKLDTDQRGQNQINIKGIKEKINELNVKLNKNIILDKSYDIYGDGLYVLKDDKINYIQAYSKREVYRFLVFQERLLK